MLKRYIVVHRGNQYQIRTRGDEYHPDGNLICVCYNYDTAQFISGLLDSNNAFGGPAVFYAIKSKKK